MRWADFRDQIASRCKMQFLYHLQNRGFTGKLVFDHDKSNLHVRVQTEEIKSQNKKEQYKESKSLSGGEKSFSTVCLLLTMWEAVGCPIRCLDEFVSRLACLERYVGPLLIFPPSRRMFSWFVHARGNVSWDILTCRTQQDAVNRRVAMRMMVDTAKAANQVQFLLITPQDMGVSLALRLCTPIIWN